MKKERKCLLCGETNEDKFYINRKNKCKYCQSVEYHNRTDKKEYIEKQQNWVSNNLIHFRVLSAKHRAIRNNREFELTNEIILNKLKEQNNLCYISKLPISIDTNNPYSLSLDRLDSNIGYTVKNTIIVTKFVNNCKNNLNIDDFIRLIKEVCVNI